MNDQPTSPFIPAQPFQPQAASPEAERPKRRSSGKKKPASGRTRKPAVAAAPPAAVAPAPFPRTRAQKKVATKRAAKETSPKARKLDIGAIVSATAGLKSDDARVLVKIYGMLGEHSAKSKAAIVSALGKLFG